MTWDKRYFHYQNVFSPSSNFLNTGYEDPYFTIKWLKLSLILHEYIHCMCTHQMQWKWLKLAHLITAPSFAAKSDTLACTSPKEDTWEPWKFRSRKFSMTLKEFWWTKNNSHYYCLRQLFTITCIRPRYKSKVQVHTSPKNVQRTLKLINWSFISWQCRTKSSENAQWYNIPQRCTVD